MDNLDFGPAALLILFAPILFHAVPTVITGAAGVIAMRKGYWKSGAAVTGAAVFSVLSTVANVIALRLLSMESYGDLYMYVLQAMSLISSGLLCGGILALVLSISHVGTGIRTTA